MFGDMRDIIGYSTYEGTVNSTKSKWTSWRFIPSYSGGLSWTFGH
jgi:hypothetical protein